MKISRKSEYRFYLFAIADEMAWCKANPNKRLSNEYQRGFLNGMNYAHSIIRETKKRIEETNAELPKSRVSNAARKRMSESAKAGWKMRRAKARGEQG